MAKLSFNVDAYTARLIGRENVSKLDGAIIELIKNTYDADASHCFLYYDEKTKSLYLGDDGHGMTEEIIRKHWMTIGRSSKRESFHSKGGRIQTGEKGIGRFALDRIAERCQMLTGTSDNSKKLIWNVDWAAFSNGLNITDVEAELIECEPPFEEFLSGCSNKNLYAFVRDTWKEHGTIFKMTGLREEWDNKLVEQIKNNLASLLPFELAVEYRIYCFAEQDTLEQAEVFSNVDVFEYDYKIDFQVFDGKIDIKLWRNEYDFGSDEDTVLGEIGYLEQKEYFHNIPIPVCTEYDKILPGIDEEKQKSLGDFKGVLYFSKVSQSKNDRKRFYQKDITGRKDLRDTFGGIKLYRDSFRVRPYGEPHSSAYDWLELSRRKTVSPAGIANPKETWRVSADQMMGSVFISRINESLPDQSNREGIVETAEFQYLREFIRNVITLLEKDRQGIFRKLDELYKKEHPTEGIQEKINVLAAKNERQEKKKSNTKEDYANKSEDTQGIDPKEAKLVLDEKDEQIENLENEIKMLRALATTGIVTNTYIHEFKSATHRLNMKIIMAKEAIDLDQDIERAQKYIDEANVIRATFNSWFQVTIDAVKKDKRTRKNIDIVELIGRLVESWNTTLKPENIFINFNRAAEQEVMLRCFPYEIETIVNNLIANSTASFERVRVSDKQMEIKIYEEGDYVVLKYSDTGNGLSIAYKKEPERILEAFESDKRDSKGDKIGTGMGMWIVNNTVSDYNGIIDLQENIAAEQGFYITIYLRR